MITNSTKLKRMAEKSPIKDCALPVLICSDTFEICFVNNSARALSENFTSGNSVLTLIPTLSKELFGELNVRCLTFSIEPHGIYTSVAVTEGNTGRVPYYAVVFRSYPILPPKDCPWYVYRNYSYLANSMDKLMTHACKTDKSIIKYEAQLTRFCAYLFNKCAAVPVNTNINELLSAIVRAVTPPLSTRGVSAEFVCEDNAYTTFDSSLIPAADLTVAMINALVLFSGAGRIRIMREQVEGTELLEVTVRTQANSEIRDKIQTFDDLLSSADPICVELAAMKDRADANGLSFAFRYEGDDMVLFYRTKGRMSDSVEFKSPELMRDVTDHLAALSAALFELVKTSLYSKEI